MTKPEVEARIDGALLALNKLKENTTKQPFYAAPEAHQVLEAIAKFMESDLDYCINVLEEVLNAVEDGDAA